MASKLNSVAKKSMEVEKHIKNNIKESILDYIAQNVPDAKNTVAKGQSFCEWVLLNVFELREDELGDATEISGKSDNGIDAVFDINGELYLIQSKYNLAHSYSSILQFRDDIERLLENPPITDRQIVKEKCMLIRDKHEKRETIRCIYVTDVDFEEAEKERAKEIVQRISNKYTNVEMFFYDLNKIMDSLEEKKGQLPKEFRGKKFSIQMLDSFETDGTTVVGSVYLKDFARFVKSGGDLLFHSNIRNYLNSTDVNKGINFTLLNESEKFWYFNNGVTIVCDEFTSSGRKIIQLVEPQIVNGCQTAKSIERFYSTRTNNELEQNILDGKLLLKIIKTKKSAEASEKKKLRDEITRYTNSQNAVRGLDFYSLDEFQRDLQIQFKTLGYYYEIQRGAYVTLDKTKKQEYKGLEQYSYLYTEKFKFVLPAKEVIQAFTSGIKQQPGIAYGNPSELTPNGSKWKDIVNDDTRMMPVEHFLYPYLVLMYAKEQLGYKNGAEDFRRSASLFYLSAFYQVIMQVVGKINNTIYDKPEDVNIAIYRKIFNDKELNMRLLDMTDDVLSGYFEDTAIVEQVDGDLKNFLKKNVTKQISKNALIVRIQNRIKQKLLDDVRKVIS